jgi:pimeloyl-ACP methyl ester carboxylesterase
MKERIPGARLELLEGCGHVPMWSKAEKANQRIEEFLRGLKE